MKNTFFAFLIVLFSLVTAIFTPTANAEQCQTLYAGQTIDVGSVCVDNDENEVTVTYATTGAWQLLELHLFVGTDFAQIPVTNSGNPKLGLFPYTASVMTQTYSFTISFSELGTTCDTLLVIAAHAVVGNGYTTETAWGAGNRFTPRGSWATWFSYYAPCDNGEDPGDDCTKVETGFAYGQDTLISVVAGSNRWGWQLTLQNGDSGSTPIYAAAGNNDINNGDLVGELQYSYSNGVLLADYYAYAGYGWNVTHLYADDVMITTTSPGQFGNTQEFLTPQTLVPYVIAIDPADAQTIYVVAHAEVCYTD